MEWFNKLTQNIKEIWNKWGIVQKIIFFSIIAIFIVSIALLVTFNISPEYVPILNTQIKDEILLDKISSRLDREGINFKIDEQNRILVPNKFIAQEARNILFREDLMPSGIDPWEIFDTDRWTTTDFERDVNFRRSLQLQLQQHIKSISDIDDVSVIINMPDESFFESEKKEGSVSVIITPKPGSDIEKNKTKVLGIEKLIKAAVSGSIKPENIIITSIKGEQLNSKDMDLNDKISEKNALLELKKKKELEYLNRIDESLKDIFSKNRIEVMNVDIEMDYGEQEIETKEILPIILVKDNPDTPANEGKVVESVPISTTKELEEAKGTNIIPQGPAGQEGEVPPIYKDSDTTPTTYKRNNETVNNEVSIRNTTQKGTPQITRISVSVNIDGTWKEKFDEKGKLIVMSGYSIDREYIELSNEDKIKAENLIKGAIGYREDRGDNVFVENIRFDRQEEFRLKDLEYFGKQRAYLIAIISFIAFLFIILLLIINRNIQKKKEEERIRREREEAERRRVQREEELRRIQESGGSSLDMSENRGKMELYDNSLLLAKEKPEDVAQLIKTWLLED